MLSDEDIYRVAHFMMHEHGCDAELEAVTRADRMVQRGDRNQVLIWFRIWWRIALMRQSPSGWAH
jgi:hypothetical protein